MKLKLKVNNIESGADTIKIVAYNERNVIEEFKKEDYGENWEGLKGREIYINPYFVGDVNQLKVIGTKSHDLSWDDEEKKNLWKEYASDKLDILILPYGREDLDYEKIIKVSNLKGITNPSTGQYVCDLLKLDYYKYCKFDFSKFPTTFYTTINSSGNNVSYLNFDRVYKLPKIPSNFPYVTWVIRDNTYNNYIHLSDVSNLDTSGLTHLRFFLKNNKDIEDISNLDFSNLKDGTKAFENASNIKKLPPLVFPKLETAQQMFDIKDLEIEEIDLSKSSDYVTTSFYNIFNNSVKIKKIKLGTASFSILGGTLDFGVVNIGNAKNIHTGSNSTAFVVNSSGYNSVKAFPAMLMAATSGVDRMSLFSVPSTPPDPDNKKIIWVDSISHIFQTIKPIVKEKKQTIKEVKTMKNSFTGQIELPLPFELNEEYPYKFKLINVDYSDNSYTRKLNYSSSDLSNLKIKSLAVSTNEEKNKLLLDADFYDIADNSSFVFNLKDSIIYTAKIDDDDFVGRFCPDSTGASYKIIFKIEENLDFGFELEEDSSDDATE